MKRWLVILGMLAAFATAGRGVEFARPFGSQMVLPHGVSCPVWGTADPGAEVELVFGDVVRRTRADAAGAWRVSLPALAPSATGRELVAVAGTQRSTLGNVLVGEVWLCSGQSNMDFPLVKAVGGRAEAATAGGSPGIRLCDLTGVPTDNRRYDDATLARLTPDRHFRGSWTMADASSAGAVSAIAWWTAKALHTATGLPIGIVENAVGGSGAEAWLPSETLASRPEYRCLLDNNWLDCDRIGAWARGRAKLNLGGHVGAMHPFRPGFLFESGVRQWSGFPFTGVLWYQGETNAEVPDDAWNERLLKDLVTGWRTALRQPALPFYMVQLPRIGGNDPLRAHWPRFREVQARAAADLTDVRLIVTRDLGWDSPDVHPPDKRPVAERLAAAILERRPR